MDINEIRVGQSLKVNSERPKGAYFSKNTVVIVAKIIPELGEVHCFPRDSPNKRTDWVGPEDLDKICKLNRHRIDDKK